MELDGDFRSDQPIWQGDIFGFGGWEQAHPLDRFGVVITADCDIQRSRPDRELVYLRIIGQQDYIELIWAREKLERDRDKILVDSTGMINRLRRDQSSENIDLEQPAIERWLSQTPAEEICDSIAVSDLQARSRLIDNIERAKQAMGFCRDTLGKPCLDRLGELRAKSKPELIRSAAGELSQVRDDLFFLTGFQEPLDRAGYYVLLDRIGSVRLDSISGSLTEVRQGKKAAYRFGRLNRQFKYALVQKFAFLFQRIGLPDGHKQSHSKSLALLHQTPEVSQ